MEAFFVSFSFITLAKFFFLLLKKLLKILLFLIFLILSCSKGKNYKESDKSSSDSLSIYMSIAQNENYSTKKRIIYNKKAFSILLRKKNDIVSRGNLYSVANQFCKLQQDNELKDALRIVLEKSFEKNDTLHIAKSYYLLGSQNIN